MAVVSYRARSQSMLLGAWLLWVLALVAIHFEFDPRADLRHRGAPRAHARA